MNKLKLTGTSTVYMNGTGVYHLKFVDKPGIVTTLVLTNTQALQLEEMLKTSS